jgi:FtsH-binding integral membrane protein
MNPVVLQLRVMQVVMIVSVPLFFFVSRTLQSPAQSVNASIQWVIVLCAAGSALLGFIVQPILLRARSQSLPPALNSTPLGPWRAGHIVRFATAESVALFGFVLRALGCSPNLVYLLFGSGLLLLLLWRPGAIPTQTKSQGSIG